MIGQLEGMEATAIGLVGKFSGIFNVMVSNEYGLSQAEVIPIGKRFGDGYRENGLLRDEKAFFTAWRVSCCCL